METVQFPPDFRLVYEWCAASVPPPDHYEVQITLSASLEGEIVFIPDYPAHQPPRWRERFACLPADIRTIYALIHDHKLDQTKWRRPARHPVGGEQQWCQFTAGGQTCHIPPELTRLDDARAGFLYAGVRSLVPPGLWTRLHARFERYHRPAEA